MLDITKFKYYQLTQEERTKEKTKRAINRNLPAKERSAGTEKLLVLKTLRRMRKYMAILALGDTNDLLLLKQLKLEREYMRKLEIRNLSIEIERVTGQPAGGSYTLAEIGDVLGLTRERVRQIEAGAMKVLKHPHVGRAIKHYMEVGHANK